MYTSALQDRGVTGLGSSEWVGGGELGYDGRGWYVTGLGLSEWVGGGELGDGGRGWYGWFFGCGDGGGEQGMMVDGLPYRVLGCGSVVYTCGSAVARWIVSIHIGVPLLWRNSAPFTSS